MIGRSTLSKDKKDRLVEDRQVELILRRLT